MKKPGQVLLLVDIQNDYFAGGKHPLVGSEQAVVAAREVLWACREQGVPVIHIQHVSTRPDAGFFLPNTPGVDIHADVYPLADELVLQKHYPNSFRDTGLLAALQALNVQELLVAGMMTHMCIDTTVRAAADLGFPVTLVTDATASWDLCFAGQTVVASQVVVAYLAALIPLFARGESAASLVESLRTELIVAQDCLA